MKQAKIDYRFKILYALGIIMVVCGHVRGGGISLGSDWFPYYGHHLALFIFCSGYFYKKKSEQNIKKYIIKKFRSLIIPLYIYTLIYGVIVQILKLKGFSIGNDLSLYNLFIAPITNGHQFIFNMGGWFIVPLFMVEIFYALIRKVIYSTKKCTSETLVFILSIVIGIVGIYLASQGYHNGWWLVLVRMLYFLPFFSIGFYYKKVLEKYEKKIPSFWFFTVIFIMKLIIAYIYRKMPAYTPSCCNDFVDGPFMPIIIGCLGIAFWLRVATILEPVIGKSKAINTLANNTYSIMMNHFAGFMILKTIYAFLNKYFYIYADFNWNSYKSNIWWYYVPRDLDYMLILYVVFGIVFSIIIQKIIDKFKKHIIQLKTNYKSFIKKKDETNII